MLSNTSIYIFCTFILLWIYKRLRRWIQKPRYPKNIQVDGKVVIITGAIAGIGKTTAIELARRGATVYITSSCLGEGEEAKKEIITSSGSDKIRLRKLDLANFKSIREFVDRFKVQHGRLDILINNAAVMLYDRKPIKNGLNSHLGINYYLGHFLLTNLLLDLLRKSTPSRIINVSSASQAGVDRDNFQCSEDYEMFKEYGRSKVANVLFTKELARKLSGTGVSVFAVHPGVVDVNFSDCLTQILKNVLVKHILKTASEAAQTTIYCALEPSLEQHSGMMFQECELSKEVNPEVDSQEICKWLWNESEKLTQINGNRI